MEQAALGARPDLAALNDKLIAARQYSKAERDLWMPTISAMGAAGGTPVRADQIQSSWYGTAGANIGIPIFNGFLFNAEEKEASCAPRLRRKTCAPQCSTRKLPISALL
jgi:outer membrane protein